MGVYPEEGPRREERVQSRLGVKIRTPLEKTRLKPSHVPEHRKRRHL